jgi:hypothetical protein
MMHGSAVRRLQELGDLIGCDTGPNDGIFGRDTEKAVKLIQKKVSVKVDGICGPVTWKALLDYIDSKEKPDLGRLCLDIRGTHPHPKNYSHKRTWDEIRGITIHQCGILMPENGRGWRRLNAHVGFTQLGKWVLVNDFTDMIWHGQGLSKHTIGLEFSGNYCGIDGDLKTLWRGGGGPHEFNLAMHLAANDAFQFIVDEFEENNRRIECINAHRQSSATRRADPGSELWQNVAMVWAKRLGLKSYDGGESYCLKKGKPIPKEWNGDYKTKY